MSPTGAKIERLQEQRAKLVRRIRTSEQAVVRYNRLREDHVTKVAKAYAALNLLDHKLDALLDEKLSAVVSVNDPQWQVEREEWDSAPTEES